MLRPSFVTARNLGDDRARSEALDHHLRLLLLSPAPPATAVGYHFHASDRLRVDITVVALVVHLVHLSPKGRHHHQL